LSLAEREWCRVGAGEERRGRGRGAVPREPTWRGRGGRARTEEVVGACDVGAAADKWGATT
jgi:hypothetical protein